MADTARDLIGLHARSRDGVSIGKVVDALADVESRSEYAFIKKRFGRGLVVPMDVVEVRDDSIVVPFTSSYLDMAPHLAAGEPISSADRARIDSFYHAKAA
jgi:hypothetical protein